MEKNAKAVAAGDREKSRSDIEAHAADSALGDLCVCVRERRRQSDRYSKLRPSDLRVDCGKYYRQGSTTDY